MRAGGAAASLEDHDGGCLQSLQKVVTIMQLDLLPSKLGDVHAGVEDLLNDMLMRYDEGLDAVVMAVGPHKVLSKEAVIQPYFPLCRLKVQVALLLFTPQEDAMLTGRVIQVGQDFIGLLVLGVINASIAKSEMRSEWTWESQAQEWRSSKHSKHVICNDSHVQFTVASVQKLEAFFSITGRLMSKSTGAVEYLAGKGKGKSCAGTPATKPFKGSELPSSQGNTNDCEKSSKKKTKHDKHSKGRATAEPEQAAEPMSHHESKKRKKVEVQAANSPAQKSESKKRKSAEEKAVEQQEAGSEQPQKKRKKGNA
mmetsp:Transcript_17385/g.29800  ORF Transcript_17385/g.29800 Transcript_17385/m.29800 type:complete len:311 (+) Transcript_17385:162-1094(+)|eukprot:CAMPEP_0119109306 /NCGR_PEP_ID=MMETSP1180-20130426/17836_1 /TAXON_ID=3052 ORGANISM="Chlamydomonas cf sp, Strain CCMP681" /NCGR_SAMPLE_ID=MMETSP1180 /ASSEMBLY_ACC=CAM_ASM_000741 /LENGTH=310 /DNA_ID=CAMNT_0007095047 /DNA_START=142 /DNA_END=1074 /DNA_ORIENTATION=-